MSGDKRDKRPEACRAQLARFVEAGVTTLGVDVVASELPWLEAQRTVLPG